MKTGWEVNVNEYLAEELHTPAVKKFKKRKVYARFEMFPLNMHGLNL